jgi:hypothetical protein
MLTVQACWTLDFSLTAVCLMRQRELYDSQNAMFSMSYIKVMNVSGIRF